MLIDALPVLFQFRFTSKKQGEADEKDEWETEVEQSEISLAALTGLQTYRRGVER